MLLVARTFDLCPDDLKLRTNLAHIVRPRQVAMYLSRRLTVRSYPEIAQAFGGKHHTTVMHAVHKIERDRRREPDLDELIETLMRRLGKPVTSPWPRATRYNDFSRLEGT